MPERELRVKCRGCGKTAEGGIDTYTDRIEGFNSSEIWGMFFFEKSAVKEGPWSPIYLCEECEKYEDDLI